MTSGFKNLLTLTETPNGATPPLFDPLADVNIPAQGDWTDHGTFLTQSPGQWDARFEGMISPCAIIKIGSVYHLYYIGADGDRGDGGPANRKLGVATATDPLGTWTKFAGNPIITYAVGIPSCDECGVFSAAMFVDDDNTILCYYGAMEETSPGSVRGDIALSISTDGFAFTDQGIVWSANDSGITTGNEIFPCAAFKNAGTYYIYHLEASGAWDLWLAQGNARDNITSDAEVDNTRLYGDVSGPVRKNVNDIILPTTLRSNWDTEMRTADITTPQTLATQATYAFGATNHQHRVIYLDRVEATWLMPYYDPANFDFRIKTAPMVLA